MKTKKNMYPSVSLFDNLEEPVGIVVPILTDCDADEDFSYGIDKVGDELPILPLRNLVLFPGVAMPIIIGREKSMNLPGGTATPATMLTVQAGMRGSTILNTAAVTTRGISMSPTAGTIVSGR